MAAAGIEQLIDLVEIKKSLKKQFVKEMTKLIRKADDTVEEAEITEDVLTAAYIKQFIDDGDLKKIKKSLKKQFMREMKKLIKKARK